MRTGLSFSSPLVPSVDLVLMGVAPVGVVSVDITLLAGGGREKSVSSEGSTDVPSSDWTTDMPSSDSDWATELDCSDL